MLQLPCTTADPEEYKLVCSDFYFGKIYITLFLCSCSHMIKFIIYTQPLRAVHILNINIHFLHLLIPVLSRPQIYIKHFLSRIRLKKVSNKNKTEILDSRAT